MRGTMTNARPVSEAPARDCVYQIFPVGAAFETRTGLRPVDELQAGDEVRAPDGTWRVIFSIDRMTPGTESVALNSTNDARGGITYTRFPDTRFVRGLPVEMTFHIVFESSTYANRFARLSTRGRSPGAAKPPFKTRRQMAAEDSSVQDAV